MLPDFETPEFSGDVLAALLADPDRKAQSGKALIGAEAGPEIWHCDPDGKSPQDWTARHGAPLAIFHPAGAAMIQALYVVLTNAAPGRDADFNDWYSNVHARDTMRMRGALAQQRFRSRR